MRKAHDRAGRSKLWADIERFDFTGTVYRSALVPASMERIAVQIKSVSPYVDKILCYAFPGLLARPGSPACYPGGAQEKLYADYLDWSRKLT